MAPGPTNPCLLACWGTRSRRAMEKRTFFDDERISHLEDQLKQARYITEEREQMYEEVRTTATRAPS